MSYGSRMADKGGSSIRETNESGGKGGSKNVIDNGISSQKISSSNTLKIREGEVKRTVESFQKSKNTNEFGY